MNLHALVIDPKKLETYDKYISPEDAYEKLKNDRNNKDLIEIVAKDPEFAFTYARDIIKGEFLLGEDAIATSACYSYFYAIYVLNAPKPSYFDSSIPISIESMELATEKIHSDTDPRGFYLKLKGKKRFWKGEKAIASDEYWALQYAHDIIRGPWPEAGNK